MAKDLLLEIGLEEVPARFVRGAAEQLKERIAKWMEEARIGAGEVRLFATPRRIAVLVRDVAEKQEDTNEELKGPSRKIAQDEKGDWSKAAVGFARSQGVELADLYFKEIGGVEYVHAVKQGAGVETNSLLSQSLTQIITTMSFPKNMRWGAYEQKFVRPIRWLVALYGDELIPLEIADVRSGRTTKGHRFLGADAEIESPASYEKSLEAQFVIADPDKRRERIAGQIRKLADERGWSVPMKDDLLEEVLFLVEYPTALSGSFNPDFLHIPQEVLITSMREHQRYFPVLDAKGSLLPHFVTVRNGNAESLEQVAKGNEKVLRARLSDARFFYEEDQKTTIDSALQRLETIVFHEELGTVGDKVRRIGKVASAIADRLHLATDEREAVKRTAAICKFDLVTQMVYEFPELQGVMGEDYASKAGEPEKVARGIFEHYQPRFSGDDAPSTTTGAIVGIADKIDTITGCFSIGIVPTGSQDPYALRRQAAGILQILLERDLAIRLGDIFDIALHVLEEAGLLKRNREEIRNSLYDFFSLRVKNILSERGIRYDVSDAVMAAGFDNLPSAVRRADILLTQTGSAGFKTAVESYNRTANLAAKAETSAVSPALFEDNAENVLYEAWQSVHDRYERLLDSGSEREALAALGELEAPITGFFDAVMVMADDDAVRRNRLALLSVISSDLKRFADFSKLVWA